MFALGLGRGSKSKHVTIAFGSMSRGNKALSLSSIPRGNILNSWKCMIHKYFFMTSQCRLVHTVAHSMWLHFFGTPWRDKMDVQWMNSFSDKTFRLKVWHTLVHWMRWWIWMNWCIVCQPVESMQVRIWPNWSCSSDQHSKVRVTGKMGKQTIQRPASVQGRASWLWSLSMLNDPFWSVSSGGGPLNCENSDWLVRWHFSEGALQQTTSRSPLLAGKLAAGAIPLEHPTVPASQLIGRTHIEFMDTPPFSPAKDNNQRHGLVLSTTPKSSSALLLLLHLAPNTAIDDGQSGPRATSSGSFAGFWLWHQVRQQRREFEVGVSKHSSHSCPFKQTAPVVPSFHSNCSRSLHWACCQRFTLEKTEWSASRRRKIK